MLLSLHVQVTFHCRMHHRAKDSERMEVLLLSTHFKRFMGYLSPILLTVILSPESQVRARRYCFSNAYSNSDSNSEMQIIIQGHRYDYRVKIELAGTMTSCLYEGHSQPVFTGQCCGGYNEELTEKALTPQQIKEWRQHPARFCIRSRCLGIVPL